MKPPGLRLLVPGNVRHNSGGNVYNAALPARSRPSAWRRRPARSTATGRSAARRTGSGWPPARPEPDGGHGHASSTGWWPAGRRTSWKRRPPPGLRPGSCCTCRWTRAPGPGTPGPAGRGRGHLHQHLRRSGLAEPARARAGAGKIRVALPGTDAAAAGRRFRAAAPARRGRAAAEQGPVAAPARTCRQLTDLPWTASLAGSDTADPAYAALLRQETDRLGLADRVRLPGELRGAALDAEWAAADLSLLISRAETYGLVVTESLARGVPVVVRQGTGAVEALAAGTPGAAGTAGAAHAPHRRSRAAALPGDRRRPRRGPGSARGGAAPLADRTRRSAPTGGPPRWPPGSAFPAGTPRPGPCWPSLARASRNSGGKRPGTIPPPGQLVDNDPMTTEPMTAQLPPAGEPHAGAAPRLGLAPAGPGRLAGRVHRGAGVRPGRLGALRGRRQPLPHALRPGRHPPRTGGRGRPGAPDPGTPDGTRLHLRPGPGRLRLGAAARTGRRRGRLQGGRPARGGPRRNHAARGAGAAHPRRGRRAAGPSAAQGRTRRFGAQPRRGGQEKGRHHHAAHGARASCRRTAGSAASPPTAGSTSSATPTNPGACRRARSATTRSAPS